MSDEIQVLPPNERWLAIVEKILDMNVQILKYGAPMYVVSRDSGIDPRHIGPGMIVMKNPKDMK